MNRIKLLPIVLSVILFSGCEFGMKDLVDELTQPSTFTVTYNSNGALIGAVPIDNNEYREGAVVTVPDNSGNLEKGASIYFTGWNTSPDGQGNNYTSSNTFIMGKSDVVLYANWKEGTFYSVAYDANGGTGVVPVDNTFYEEGTPVYVKDGKGLSRDLCSFGGWNKSASGLGENFTAGNSFAMGAENVTLYAKWITDQTYSVTYDGNGSTGGLVPEDSKRYRAGDTVTVKSNERSLVKTGYNFGGWNDSVTNTTYTAGTGTFIMGSADVTLDADWIDYRYLVSFDLMGAISPSSLPDIQVKSPDTMTGALPVDIQKTGYNFGGWWTNLNETGVQFYADTVVTNDITLFAKWNSYTYTVRFDLQGATSPLSLSDIVVISPNTMTGTLPGDIQKTGYNFGGWWTDVNGTGKQFTSATAVTGDITVYARWHLAKKWFSITSSYDGTKLAAVVSGGYIYTSTDSGANWTERTVAGSRDWRSITSSYDGKNLAAIILSGYIYTSTDSGETWIERTGAGSGIWNSITSSSGGQYLAAASSYGVKDYGHISTSNNTGATWSERIDAGRRTWSSITSSSDGNKLAAVVSGGYIYTSTDYGATWTGRTDAGSRGWRTITSSTDGTKIAATVYGGYIYTLGDSGATWAERTSSGIRNWNSITSSSNGQYLAAVVENGYIYTSNNSGATWIEQTGAGSRGWFSITSSTDGTKLAAVVYGGYIYTSSDYGVTWTECF